MPGFLNEHMLGLAVQRRRAGSDDGGTWQAGLSSERRLLWAWPTFCLIVIPHCWKAKKTAPMTKKDLVEPSLCAKPNQRLRSQRPDGRGRSFAWDPLVCVLCDSTGVVVVATEIGKCVNCSRRAALVPMTEVEHSPPPQGQRQSFQD